MKSRLYKVLIKYAVILGVGLAYWLFTLWTGWGIPCLFYKITGFQCPACGVSRMLSSLLRFDFVAAFHYHPFLLVTLPLLLFCLIYPDVRYVLWGDRSMGWVNVLLWGEIVLLLLFGVLRNMVVYL